MDFKGKQLENLDERINRDICLGWAGIIAILIIGYLIEVLKGQRTLAYLLVFTILNCATLLICLGLAALQNL